MKFLGPIVSPKGFSVDSTKTDVVQNWIRPNNALKVQSFLGLVGYYQRFVEGLFKIVEPLTSLMKKETRFESKDRHEHTFQ